jgi:hypothetical protein
MAGLICLWLACLVETGPQDGSKPRSHPRREEREAPRRERDKCVVHRCAVEVPADPGTIALAHVFIAYHPQPQSRSADRKADARTCPRCATRNDWSFRDHRCGTA